LRLVFDATKRKYPDEIVEDCLVALQREHSTIENKIKKIEEERKKEEKARVARLN